MQYGKEKKAIGFVGFKVALSLSLSLSAKRTGSKSGSNEGRFVVSATEFPCWVLNRSLLHQPRRREINCQSEVKQLK
jgi:hypothetical protein